MKKKEDNIIGDKSVKFALRIVKCYQYLQEDKKEYIMSKQLLRSGTSIGANIREGMFAQSHPDFISKMGIALKEAEETDYWLYLLSESEFLDEMIYKSFNKDIKELIKLLVSIIKTARKAQNG